MTSVPIVSAPSEFARPISDVVVKRVIVRSTCRSFSVICTIDAITTMNAMTRRQGASENTHANLVTRSTT